MQHREGVRVLAAAATGLALLAPVPAPGGGPEGTQWPHPGGDAGGSRYSALADIHPGNLSELEVAWTYRHGDVYESEGYGGPSGTSFEATPLMVEGKVIVSTPYNRVIALDPATGEEIWIFDPLLDRTRRYPHGFVNRGVEYWRDPDAEGFCSSRIFVATTDSRLIAIDAATGKPCPGFGKGGTVDLHVGIDGLEVPEHHKSTSPPVATRDAVVVGSSLADNRARQPSGDVRGYDVRSGRLLWTFHVIPHEGEFGTETWEDESWRRGQGANAWGPLSADLDSGLVFVPTSTASPDYYGGSRPGDNLFSDTLLALDGRTGERVWHRQLIHHDVWDYDLASQPLLVDLERDGRAVPVVAQLTKTGFVFVFERATGKPFFAIEERPVPQSDVPGEKTSPTQPFPRRPPPLVPVHALTEKDLRPGPQRAECRELLRTHRNEGIYTPPSERGTIIHPAPSGGADWHGGAFDPERRILYVPSNNLTMEVTVPPLDRLRDRLTGGAADPPSIVPQASGRFGFELRCLQPPWGLLVAVDLQAGEILWRLPIGRTADGIEGAWSFGPALVTGGGLVFLGGTAVPELHVHDAATGARLRTIELPASLHAGPITYRAGPDRRQYLLVTPGGHQSFVRYQQGARLGDWVIAFALPRKAAGAAQSTGE